MYPEIQLAVCCVNDHLDQLEKPARLDLFGRHGAMKGKYNTQK
jgi:hypothetical protein